MEGNSSMATKKGLGKGLDMLIPSEPIQVPTKKEVKKVDQADQDKIEMVLDIKLIEPNQEQPRKQFDENSMIELTESIKQFGIIQPLIVQKQDDYYKIIAGERRWRAAKMAGLKEVPVIVREYSEKEILEISLIENLQREDLNPIEEALSYRRLINEFGLKQEEVADRVSKSRTAITNSMRLLKLDKRVQQMLIDEMISSGHARAILPIEDGELQYQLSMRIFDEKLSVRDIEKIMKDILNPREPKEKKVENDFLYRDLEEKIKNIMGTKVTIKNKSNHKGKIELEYYSDEELERLIDLLQSINK